MHFISVVVVTIDRPESFARCVRSLVEQSLKSFELVILQNGKSCHYVKPEIRKVSPAPGVTTVVVDSPETLGVAAARNLAARATSGRYIVWLDDDAWLESREALDTIQSELLRLKEPEILAYAVADERDRRTRRLVPGRRPGPPRTGEFTTTFFLGSGCAISRDLFVSSGMYDEGFAYQLEELEFSLRIAELKPRIIFTPRVTVSHRSLVGHRSHARAMVLGQASGRPQIAILYLPLPMAVVHLVVWLTYLWALAIRYLVVRNLVAGLCLSVGYLPARLAERRIRRLDQSTIKWLRSLPNRLWY